MSNIAAKRVAEDDLDSPMQDSSSPASSPATPQNNAHLTSELSPPDSQQVGADPTTAPSPTATSSKPSKTMPPSANLNTNGKRGFDSNGTTKAGVDKDSGYTWEREEEAPGWSWQNTKARDEQNRAWANVLEKDRRIGNKYGDLLLK